MAQPRPSISVVIPARNAAPFVGEALASVAAQTTSPDEVIVIDDGSTDATAHIAAAAGATVISIDRSGPAAARNRGIEAASGDWIAFLDADDVWQPTKLEKQGACAAHWPEAGLVVAAHYRFGEGAPLGSRVTSIPTEVSPEPSARLGDPPARRFSDVGEWFFRIGARLDPSAVLARRDLLTSRGGFDEDLVAMEDWDCFMRLLADRSLVVIDEPLVGRRLRADGISRDVELMSTGLNRLIAKVRTAPRRYPPGTLQTCIAMRLSSPYFNRR